MRETEKCPKDVRFYIYLQYFSYINSHKSIGIPFTVCIFDKNIIQTGCVMIKQIILGIFSHSNESRERNRKFFLLLNFVEDRNYQAAAT